MEYIASTDDGLVTQLANFSAKAPTVQAALGLTAADITAITADYNAMQVAVVDVASKQTAAQSATQAKNTTRATVVKRLRVLARRIKSNPAYTPAMGELLGLVAPKSGTGASVRAVAAEAGVRPLLQGNVGGDGTVTIRFTKRNYTGAMVYCRRGEQTQFTLLGKQLVSPLIDDRPNLTAGVPETREYRAQFIKKDTPVGQMSNIVVLTLPAGGMIADPSQTADLKAAA